MAEESTPIGCPISKLERLATLAGSFREPLTSAVAPREKHISIKTIIIVGVIAVGIGYYVYLDYHWDEMQINRYTGTDWVPAAIQDNYIRYPWNFVKCSVTGLWSIRLSSMIRITDCIVIAEVIHIDRHEGKTISYNLYDCKNAKIVFLSSNAIPAPAVLTWQGFEPGTPGSQMLAFVSSRLENIAPKLEDDKNTQSAAPDRR